MKKYIVLGFFSSLLFLQACKKDNAIEESVLQRDYFPVNVGHELIYDVEYITKSGFSGIWDSSLYQIKEVITETYLDNEGRETQRIERFIKNDTSTTWTIYKVWASNRLNETGERVEDNIRYIKLNFFLSLNKGWDGNSKNTLGLRTYQYTSMNEPLTLGSLTFDSTLTVLQFEDSTLINANYYVEKYASKIGMIYRENKDINYNFCGNPSCDSIIDAYIYKETLVSYIK